MLDEVRIACGHQRQGHCSCVRHVSSSVKPILEEEEHAKREGCGLTLAVEISGKEQRDQPLQNGSSPEAQRRPEPAEKQVSRFMYDQVCGIDKEECHSHAEDIHQECEIKEEPRGDRPAGHRPPVFSDPAPFHKRVEVFTHLNAILGDLQRDTRLRRCGRDRPVRWLDYARTALCTMIRRDSGRITINREVTIANPVARLPVCHPGVEQLRSPLWRYGRVIQGGVFDDFLRRAHHLGRLVYRGSRPKRLSITYSYLVHLSLVGALEVERC